MTVHPTTTAGAVDETSWFARPRDTRAPVLLFCLPYAGAGSSVFAGWQEALGAEIGVQPVVLPGRERRYGDEGPLDVAQIADAITARADRPYALYGHSLGGRLCFEVTRELRRRGSRLPSHVYLGATRPPDLDEPLSTVASAPDAELLDRLVGLGGIPAALAADRDLLEFALPAMRMDFGWLHAYRYGVETPLPVPLTVFGGSGDHVVPARYLGGWRRHTSARFRLHVVPGDHFFLHRHRDRIAEQVRRDLLATGRTPLALPAERAVHLWHADLDSIEPGTVGDLVSPSERARAARLRNPLHAKRFLTRSALLRRLLQHYGVSPGTEEFATGSRGKPYLPGGSSPQFSVAHSQGVAVMAIAADGIGVDVERDVPMPDPQAFADGALSAAEREVLSSDPDPDRLCLLFWTAKEAVLKASGDGLSVEPDHVCFADCARALRARGSVISEPWRAVVPPGVARLRDWWVHHLDLDGALAAVATHDREPWLTVTDASELGEGAT